jgi:hypothetical protein
VPLCTCPKTELCAACYGRELVSHRGQAAAIGQCWAEEVARRPEYRGHERWPDDERAMEIARRRVRQLAADPRLRDELAVMCIAGAAAWWERRPAAYR